MRVEGSGGGAARGGCRAGLGRGGLKKRSAARRRGLSRAEISASGLCGGRNHESGKLAVTCSSRHTWVGRGHAGSQPRGLGEGARAGLPGRTPRRPRPEGGSSASPPRPHPGRSKLLNLSALDAHVARGEAPDSPPRPASALRPAGLPCVHCVGPPAFLRRLMFINPSISISPPRLGHSVDTLSIHGSALDLVSFLRCNVSAQLSVPLGESHLLLERGRSPGHVPSSRLPQSPLLSDLKTVLAPFHELLSLSGLLPSPTAFLFSCEFSRFL